MSLYRRIEKMSNNRRTSTDALKKIIVSYMRQGSVENPTIWPSDFWSRCSSVLNNENGVPESTMNQKMKRIDLIMQTLGKLACIKTNSYASCNYFSQ